jgi:hypothetical protein
VNANDDLLERGFRLAYFIYPSRPQALKILSGAIHKLKAHRGRENRRVYWRDKYLKRGITRITREEGDMLQWLILSTLLEADSDYTVDLRSRGPHGELEELNSYTFHATKSPR